MGSDWGREGRRWRTQGSRATAMRVSTWTRRPLSRRQRRVARSWATLWGDWRQQYMWGSVRMEQGREGMMEECNGWVVVGVIQMQKQDKKVYLDLQHSFGSNFGGEGSRELGVIEEEGQVKMVYTVGKTVAKQDVASREMEFIRLSDHIESIECVAISPTHNHIAVCEKIKNENFLLLNMYGLRGRDSEIKHFKLPQTDRQATFKIIAFAPSQPKYACCMTSEPDSQLMFLDISRSRGLAVSNFSVEGTDSIAICPTQSHLISCAGRSLFRLFKVEDYAFKPYQEVKKLPRARNFTCHAWFDKTKLLLGTDRGELFMVGPVGNNFEVKRQLGNVFAEEGPDPVGLSALCVFARGFVVGSTRGHFGLWLKGEESEDNFEDEYTGELARRWRAGEGRAARVAAIAICPREQQLAVAFANSSLAVGTVEGLLGAEEAEGGGRELEGDPLEYLYGGFHCGEISSMDCCLQRPIVATLSRRDNCVRLWNYKAGACELVKVFDSKGDGVEATGSELVHCLALHPLGYYLAVGCCDKLRLYHILEKELRNFREIVVRGVCSLRFSHGGHLLAAAYPRHRNSSQKNSVHLVNIYNSYTLEEVGRLSDHSNLVTALAWRSDDRELYSVGADGTTTVWRPCDPRADSKDWPAKKCTQSNARYSSVVWEPAGRSALVAGVEGGRSVVREFRVEKDLSQKLFALGGFRVSCLARLTSQWNIPAVLAGTEEGSLKVFNAVFDNIVEQSLNVHRREVSGVCTSPCGRFVLTAGRDGVVFVYQVSLTNREGFVGRKVHDQLEYEVNPLVGVLDDQLAQVVLVPRALLNEKNRYNKILEKNLEEMRRRLVLQEDEDARRFEGESEQLAGDKDALIAGLSQQQEALRARKKELEATGQAEYARLHAGNEKLLEDVEALYEKKLAVENSKYFELEGQFARERERAEAEKRGFRGRVGETLGILRREFIEYYRKAERVHAGQQEVVGAGEREFTEKVRQVEEEHEGELRKVTAAIVELEAEKNRNSIEYITNIESLKRECRLLSEDIVRYMSENELLAKQQQESQAQLGEVQAAISAKKQQLLARQEALRNREERIAEYQARIADLNKKKEVLGYRTWEMRQEIEPREDEIEFLKEEIFAIEGEFEKLLEDEKVMAEGEARVRGSRERLGRELGEAKGLTKERAGRVRRLHEEIERVVQSKSTDRQYYQLEMEALYQRHCRFMSEYRRNNQNPKGAQEIERHIAHIDQEIGTANRQTDSTLLRREEEIQKTTQENAHLITELTALRNERAKLANDLKAVAKTSDNLSRQIKQLRAIDSATPDSQLSRPTRQGHPPARRGQEQQQLPPLGPTGVGMARSSSQPAMVKGRVSKGANYDLGSLSIFTKAKLKDLEGRVEMARLNLRQREVMGRMVRQKIEEHLGEGGCEDPQLRKALADYEI